MFVYNEVVKQKLLGYVYYCIYYLLGIPSRIFFRFLIRVCSYKYGENKVDVNGYLSAR